MGIAGSTVAGIVALTKYIMTIAEILGPKSPVLGSKIVGPSTRHGRVYRLRASSA